MALKTKQYLSPFVIFFFSLSFLCTFSGCLSRKEKRVEDLPGYEDGYYHGYDIGYDEGYSSGRDNGSDEMIQYIMPYYSADYSFMLGMKFALDPSPYKELSFDSDIAFAQGHAYVRDSSIEVDSECNTIDRNSFYDGFSYVYEKLNYQNIHLGNIQAFQDGCIAGLIDICGLKETIE